MNGFDVNDGYHITPFPGCTGELVWGFGIVDVRCIYDGDPDWEPPVVVEAGGSERPSFASCLAGGCTWAAGRASLKCARTCDKSYCAMSTDGCIARWGHGVAHFGQKPAGCPLNCIALCLLRHAALRRANTGELRGASVRSTGMLGVVWVDDFVFHMRVEWHPPCGGLAAGCLVCGRGLAAAEENDEWWVGLNRQLGVSLNVKKHQRCAQTVEYAGFLSFFGPGGGIRRHRPGAGGSVGPLGGVVRRPGAVRPGGPPALAAACLDGVRGAAPG